MKRVLVVFIFMGLAFASYYSVFIAEKPSCAEASETNKPDAMTFRFTIKKGEYVFTALGNTGRSAVVPIPPWGFKEDWTLVLQLAPNLKGSTPKWDITTTAEFIDAKNTIHSSISWMEPDEFKDSDQYKALTPQLENISKLASISDPHITRVPYCVINGETHYVLIAFPHDTKLMQELFVVPKTERYKKFNWDKLWELEE